MAIFSPATSLVSRTRAAAKTTFISLDHRDLIVVKFQNECHQQKSREELSYNFGYTINTLPMSYVPEWNTTVYLIYTVLKFE
jgi:hypothetical protein